MTNIDSSNSDKSHNGGPRASACIKMFLLRAETFIVHHVPRREFHNINFKQSYNKLEINLPYQKTLETVFNRLYKILI